MDERLIDTGDLPLERRSVLPGAGFFVPDEIQDRREDEAVAAAAADASAIVVADPDSDGLACVAVIRELYPDAALVPTGPHDLSTGLERAADYGAADAPVFVCDLCPDHADDVEAPLDALGDREVRWYDHHQWDRGVERAVRNAGVELVVGDSDEVCTADVAVAELEAEADLPRRFVELAAVTRDHDLWINDDPRSADLADYAYWSEPEEYVETVAEHGPDLPDDALDYLAERRVEKEALIDRAVGRASLRDVGPWTVGLTYGRCSQNEVADGLREEGADAAVVIKPSGGVSLRGSDDFERCHEVARLVDGGGHPRAAGCKPPIFDDVLDYAHHWTTRGAVAERVVLGAFREVARADEESEEGVDTDR